MDLPDRAEQRLREEPVIWLTTVTPEGQPQTSPVWFWWDGAEFLVYSREDTARLYNIDTNPRVALNLDGNGRGGDIVSIEGRARVEREHAPSNKVAEYARKYAALIARNGWTPDSFAADYPVPIKVRPTRLRAW